LGITGLYSSRVHIEKNVWHLDVGLEFPSGVEAAKGLAVRRLKLYMNWVQNVVRQFGLYLLAQKKKKNLKLVREDHFKLIPGLPVV